MDYPVTRVYSLIALTLQMSNLRLREEKKVFAKNIHTMFQTLLSAIDISFY